MFLVVVFLVFFFICCVCILPQNNYIKNDQRQDWQDDIEKSVQSQNIDIDIPIIFSESIFLDCNLIYYICCRSNRSNYITVHQSFLKEILEF